MANVKDSHDEGLLMSPVGLQNFPAGKKSRRVGRNGNESEALLVHTISGGQLAVQRQRTNTWRSRLSWRILSGPDASASQREICAALTRSIGGIGKLVQDLEVADVVLAMTPMGPVPGDEDEPVLLFGQDWTEVDYPPAWVETLGERLIGVACTSSFTAQALIDAGLEIPVAAVGIGLDPWERLEPAQDVQVPGRAFRYLHVSDGDEVSGLDLLLDSFLYVFGADDNVSLVLVLPDAAAKQVSARVAKRFGNDVNAPHVVVLSGAMTDAQLKAIYRQCDVFVSPHRASGFGLPMARAFLAGLPVIATDWGGLHDYCDAETAWFIDYTFRRSGSSNHVLHSLWVEPKVSSLDQLLWDAHQCAVSELRAKAAAGRQRLLAKYGWEDTAQRLAMFAERCKAATEATDQPKSRIGWMTTWNTKCGIATAAARMVETVPPDDIVIFAPREKPVQPDESFCLRSWNLGKENNGFDTLLREMQNHAVRALVIQFNYGFYNHFELGRFIDKCAERGIVVFIEFHSTIDHGAPNYNIADFKDSLRKCKRILAHRLYDMERLKDMGLAENVILFPLGVVNDKLPKKEYLHSGPPLIASYGFCFATKGLVQLVEAVHLLKQQGKVVHLRMVNAQYTNAQSAIVVDQIREAIARLEMENEITFITDYLDDRESLRLLREADLIVNPYQYTAESSSASVRHCLSSGIPVAVTPLPFFDEFGDAVFRFPGITPENLAAGIAKTLQEIAGETKTAKCVEQAAQQWLDAHDYAILGPRLAGMARALMRQPLSGM